MICLAIVSNQRLGTVMQIHFPFTNGGTYTMAQVRAFEADLCAARQKDSELSKVWRASEDRQMQRRIKIREETLPIKLLADHKGYSDDATFSLKPSGNPAIDSEICATDETFPLQITIADPDWSNEGDRVQHGGYDYNLKMEALNRDGALYGSGRFHRSESEIIPRTVVTSPDDHRQARTKALLNALIRKCTGKGDTCRLLIHARGFCAPPVEIQFEQIVSVSVDQFVAGGGRLPFERIYFVDEGASGYAEIPTKR
jgi:hypothetical protein